MLGLNRETHQRQTGCLQGTRGSTQGLDWARNEKGKKISTGGLIKKSTLATCFSADTRVVLLSYGSAMKKLWHKKTPMTKFHLQQLELGNTGIQEGESRSLTRKALKNWVILFACTFPRAGCCSTRETKHWYKQQTSRFTGDSKICICNQCHAVLT